MKKNKILTESQKRQIIENKQKVIIESFASTFNKIKRIDEGELDDTQRRNLDLLEDKTKDNLNSYINANGGLYTTDMFTNQLDRNVGEIMIKEIRLIDGRWQEPSGPTVYLSKSVGNSDYGYFIIYLNEVQWRTPLSVHDGNFQTLVTIGFRVIDAETLHNDKEKERMKQVYLQFLKGKMKQIRETSKSEMNETVDTDTYFKTLSGALDHVRSEVEKMGYELDEDDMWSSFGTGGVGYGETKKGTIDLLKDGKPLLSKSGKPLNRGIQIVIYRMDSGTYELVWYKTW